MITYILDNGMIATGTDISSHPVLYNSGSYEFHDDFNNNLFLIVNDIALYAIGFVECHAGQEIWLYAQYCEEYDILMQHISDILTGKKPHDKISYGCHNGWLLYQDKEGFKLDFSIHGWSVVKDSLQAMKDFLDTVPVI